MDKVSKTLYIPLCGKAYVSGKGVILHDPKAETIWQRAKFPLSPGAQSRWLAYYLSMRAAVYDAWVTEQLAAVHITVPYGKEETVSHRLRHIRIIYYMKPVVSKYLLHLLCSDRILACILDKVELSFCGKTQHLGVCILC